MQSWLTENPEKVIAIAGVAYAGVDLIIRLLIKDKQIKAIEAKWGKVGAAIGIAYRAIRDAQVKNR